MRGLRSTIALLVVLIGLGAYIYFVTWKRPAQDAGSKQEKVFAAVQADQIDELKVKAESGDVTTLKKTSGAWSLVTPMTTAASEAETSSVTSALSALEIERVVEENPTDVKDYGLETPRIEIDFKANEGKASGRLAVGAKTPTGASMYARRNDEKRVFLVAENQNASLNKSTFDLRDKSVLKIDREKVDGVEVTAGAGRPPLQFAKTGSEWKLIKPLEARADPGLVEALVGSLETAQMKSVAAESATPGDLKKFGLDRPEATVTVHLGSARAALALGGKAGTNTVYARDASKPVVVTVDSALADTARKGAEDYRRKDVFDFRAFNATRAEFTRNGETVTLERVKGKSEEVPDSWRRASPNPADVDKSKVESLLAGLADMRATTFAPTIAKTGLDAPALTVLVKFDEGKREERVSFGKSGADVHALVPGQPGAAKIEAEKFAEANKTLDELSK
jgi:hypothetical protein